MPSAADVDLRKKNEASAAARDIGPPPAPANPERRERCSASLLDFLLAYFPAAFAKPFSQDHLDVIATLQSVIEKGGQYALAMPRGNGKTTLAIRAAEWALATGKRKYVVIVGATEAAARKLLKSIKSELWQNDDLNADYPAELWGIPQLNGDARRAGGQLCCGAKTNIVWSATELVLPTIAGSICSSHIVAAVGLTGNIRGQQHRLPTGEIIRPDLVILDDPQTRESARSASQSLQRAEIIEGDILGLAGPGEKIAAVMPCTIIEPGDLAARFLDREQHPTWQGKTTRLLYSFPENMPLWDQYNQELAEGLRIDGTYDRGNKFYATHRIEMDAGALPAWEHRFSTHELSAVQNAMNLYYANPVTFAAEYQNDPIAHSGAGSDTPTMAGLECKVNRLPPASVPQNAEKITAFIDVQGKLLYYSVIAWSTDMTGAVIEYGAFPRQTRLYYTLRDAPITIQTTYPGSDTEGGIAQALAALTDDLCSRAWHREDSVEMRVDRLLIDSGYQADVVYEAVRRSSHASVMRPSKGMGLRAGDTPMTEWERKQTQRPGYHWCLTVDTNRRRGQLLRYDTNFWKTFLAARIAAPLGNRASLSVYGDRQEQHRMLADHLAAEEPILNEAKGRQVWEWRKIQSGMDNHLLDCLVGCCAAASEVGLSIESTPQAQQAARKVIQFPSHLVRRS